MVIAIFSLIYNEILILNCKTRCLFFISINFETELTQFITCLLMKHVRVSKNLRNVKFWSSLFFSFIYNEMSIVNYKSRCLYFISINFVTELTQYITCVLTQHVKVSNNLQNLKFRLSLFFSFSYNKTLILNYKYSSVYFISINFVTIVFNMLQLQIL